MTLALTFATPPLLIGLVAAGIPFVLHLLSSVRAQELYFPTLRFLRTSMEKTARRRRIQHWLLLVLRALLLGLLAMGVAEPITKAMGGWLSGQRYAAAIILDNSFSMATRTADGGSRFDRAKAQAAALLSGDEKPALAAVLTTNGGYVSRELVGQSEQRPKDAAQTAVGFEALREGIAQATIGYAPAPLGQRAAAALEMLRAATVPRKGLYLFSDLQRISFEELLRMQALARTDDVHLFVVNAAAGEPHNVGITDLEIEGRRIVDSVLEFTATLVNSSPTDRVVEVAMRIEGAAFTRRVRKALQAAGSEGSSATVRFRHRFTRPGEVTGEVYLDGTDDLPVDNVRRFSLTIGGRVRALVVRGPATDGGMDPAMMPRLALNPYEGEAAPWPIEPATIEWEQFAPDRLAGADAVVFCDVPAFTEAQAGAVEQFTRDGGTVVFFLGPAVRPENYNERFCQQITAEGGLLPGRLKAPVGEVGPQAEALGLEWVDDKHDYLEGLYENTSDYFTVLVQRRYLLASSARPGRTLLRLAGGEPLLLLKRFGKGKVLLCTTTASPQWSNLPIRGLFLPLMVRTALLARQDLGRDQSYLADAQVAIFPGTPPAEAGPSPKLNVIRPDTDPKGKPIIDFVPVRRTGEGHVATYTSASQVGLYRWQFAQGGPDAPAGAFVVNPHGEESKLASIPADRFAEALRRRGLERVYVGESLGAVTAAAAARTRGRNWWDIVLVAVILLLTVEAVVANRGRKEEVIPAHLNPRVAGG